MFAHTVSAGESLSSIAAADGLTASQLAAANGLSPAAQLISGSTVLIPPQSVGVSVASSSAGASSTGEPAGDDAESSGSASSSGSVSGAYVVQPGDTLSAIAARAGTSVAQLAAANGLAPGGVLVSGTVLRLAGPATSVSSQVAASAQPVGATAEGSPTAPPYPTQERLSASAIGQIAAAHGVSPSLADAIAWQESGFNNALVSSADARGVMQILPGTWDWIQHSLIGGMPPLQPASAADNVRGGVVMLGSLLRSTGGDPAMAAAGYYQGLPSVQRNGVYPSTQQYVNSVMALRQRFGGG
jgi:soluble lytic murein transglycosylase-like protein